MQDLSDLHAGRRQLVLGGCVLLGDALLSARGGGARGADRQPRIEARARPVPRLDGLMFKDSNGNGRLDPYEDWRRPVAERVEDLAGRMSLAEKAGMMLIDTLNAGPAGALPAEATRYVQGEHMTRFIFRNPVVPGPGPRAPAGRSGPQITPRQAATFTNRVQELAEGTRLGVPALFKSNARDHYEQDALRTASTWPPAPSRNGRRSPGWPPRATWI